MLTRTNKIHAVRWPLISGALALLFFVAGPVPAQSVSGLQDQTKTPPVQKAAQSTPQPVSSIYKDVKIGTEADQVKKLLGKAEIDDKDGFFYRMDSEIVQIRLDENSKVRVISVTYANGSPNIPTYTDIFGDEATTAKPDGSVYRLVRYPDAGYWVAYSKTGGDKPTVTVTMQKL